VDWKSLWPPSSTCCQLRATVVVMAGTTKTAMIIRAKKAIASPTRHITSQTLSGNQSSYASSQVARDIYPLSHTATATSLHSRMPKSRSLSILPLGSVIRSLAISSISSSPVSIALLVHLIKSNLLSDPPWPVSCHHVHTCTLQVVHTLPR
jgi:hypothetical protein